jgi:hypothetical protein
MNHQYLPILGVFCPFEKVRATNTNEFFLKLLQYKEFPAYVLLEAVKERKISNELRKSKMTTESKSSSDETSTKIDIL